MRAFSNSIVIAERQWLTLVFSHHDRRFFSLCSKRSWSTKAHAKNNAKKTAGTQGEKKAKNNRLVALSLALTTASSLIGSKQLPCVWWNES